MATIGIAAACNAFSGASSPTESDASAESDAGPDATAARSDSGDATSVDGSLADAGTDGCGPGVILCDNFERGAGDLTSGGVWTVAPPTASPSNIAIVVDDAGNHYLRAQASMLPFVTLMRDAGGVAATTLTIDFDMSVDNLESGFAVPVAVYFDSPDASLGYPSLLLLVDSADGLIFDLQGCDTNNNDPATVTMGAIHTVGWNHFSATVDVLTNSATMTVSSSLLAAPIFVQSAATNGDFSPQVRVIQIGAPFLSSDAGRGATFGFDNVRITAK